MRPRRNEVRYKLTEGGCCPPWGERRAGFLLAVGTVAVLVSAGMAGAVVVPSAAPHRATASFSRVIGDDEIASLLERYNLVPQAAFMWTSGLTGTYRSYVHRDARAFLNQARAQAIESLERSLQDNTVRIREFVEVHAENELLMNPDLETQARSLLNINHKLRNALVHIRNGSPLIFSVEVTGDIVNIERLANDPTVQTVQHQVSQDGQIRVPGPIKPGPYVGEWVHVGVEQMTGAALYRAMKDIAGSAL